MRNTLLNDSMEIEPDGNDLDGNYSTKINPIDDSVKTKKVDDDELNT